VERANLLETDFWILATDRGASLPAPDDEYGLVVNDIVFTDLL
jgi:hypothetical protein